MDNVTKRSYPQVLTEVQGAIVSTMRGDMERISETTLKDAIKRYIVDHGIRCEIDDDKLVNYIYHDMAGLSFISRDGLFTKEGFEELDINAWDDVELVTHGERVKTDYSFLSPQHAIGRSEGCEVSADDVGRSKKHGHPNRDGHVFYC